jgi:hypothetical protein
MWQRLSQVAYICLPSVSFKFYVRPSSTEFIKQFFSNEYVH